VSLRRPIVLPHPAPCSAHDHYTGEFCHLWEGHEGTHQIPPPAYYKMNPWRVWVRGLNRHEMMIMARYGGT